MSSPTARSSAAAGERRSGEFEWVGRTHGSGPPVLLEFFVSFASRVPRASTFTTASPTCRASRGSPERADRPLTTASYMVCLAGVIRAGACGYSMIGRPSASNACNDLAQR